MNKKSKRKIIAIIPARGGSKGIPRKNIKLLAGKPLIAYTIEQAKKSKYLDDVYVSTEDKEIKEVAQNFGAKVIDRPEELASDTSSTESVLVHFANNIDSDILVLLQCTSPLTLSKDIDEALEYYFKGKFDTLLSACEDHGGFLCGGFLWDEHGHSVNYDYMKRPRRQDMKKLFRENGAIYIMTKKGLLKNKNRLFGKIGIYKMPRQRSFEIDEPEDFDLLESIIPKILKTEFDIKNVISKIKIVIFDVDGVFTDGSVYLNEDGQEILRFSRIDGKGIELLKKAGFKTAVISTENSSIVKRRMEKLKIDLVYLGISDKLKVYKDIKIKYNLNDENICFCGDDIQDIELINLAGLSCCPNNAQEIIKKNSKYISKLNGGSGFVREICNMLIEHKGEI